MSVVTEDSPWGQLPKERIFQMKISDLGSIIEESQYAMVAKHMEL